MAKARKGLTKVPQSTKPSRGILYSTFRQVGLEFLGFIRFILNPWLIIFSLLTLMLFFQDVPTDPLSQRILSFAQLLSSGILGGILAKRWDDIINNTSLQVRALSAIRGLQNIRLSIEALQNRVTTYLDEDNSPILSEIVDRLNLTDKQLSGSIYDWEDVLPEPIGYLRSLEKQNHLEKTIKELTERISSIDASSEESNQKIDLLIREKSSLEKQLKKTKLSTFPVAVTIPPSGLMTGGTIPSSGARTVNFGDYLGSSGLTVLENQEDK